MKLSVIKEVRTNNFNDSEIINKIQTLWNDSMQDIQKLNYKGIFTEYIINMSQTTKETIQ